MGGVGCGCFSLLHPSRDEGGCGLREGVHGWAFLRLLFRNVLAGRRREEENALLPSWPFCCGAVRSKGWRRWAADEEATHAWEADEELPAVCGLTAGLARWLASPPFDSTSTFTAQVPITNPLRCCSPEFSPPPMSPHLADGVAAQQSCMLFTLSAGEGGAGRCLLRRPFTSMVLVLLGRGTAWLAAGLRVL